MGAAAVSFGIGLDTGVAVASFFQIEKREEENVLLVFLVRLTHWKILLHALDIVCIYLDCLMIYQRLAVRAERLW